MNSPAGRGLPVLDYDAPGRSAARNCHRSARAPDVLGPPRSPSSIACARRRPRARAAAMACSTRTGRSLARRGSASRPREHPVSRGAHALE